MITIENLSKRFYKKHGSIDAISDVSLSIADGEFVSITGPSGSGKSTLLLMLGGMSTPSSGSVLWNGQNIYAWDLKRRAQWRGETVGFVFQSFNLISYLTVYENVSIALRIAERNEHSNAEKVFRLIENMKLSDRVHHLPNELSIGQQQRVALARALIKDPMVIVADEPTGNLDRETALEILAILKALNNEGKTIILVTHNPEIAGMAKRNIKIVGGILSA
ncbi:MAG: ABC transporter ATP-binding protein [Pseudomonadota bacterium]